MKHTVVNRTDNGHCKKAPTLLPHKLAFHKKFDSCQPFQATDINVAKCSPLRYAYHPFCVVKKRRTFNVLYTECTTQYPTFDVFQSCYTIFNASRVVVIRKVIKVLINVSF